jgi:hypothetical protein
MRTAQEKAFALYDLKYNDVADGKATDDDDDGDGDVPLQPHARSRHLLQ